MKEKKGDDVLGRKLEQIVRSSYTGCIDNMTEVAKIVTKFMNLSLAEILDTVDMKMKENIEVFAGCLMAEERDLGKENVKSLKYMELLCLIDNTGIDPVEDKDIGWYDIDAELPQAQFRYLGINNIYLLLKNAERTNNLINLFLSINVNTFFTYLKSINNDVFYVWDIFQHRINALKINMGPEASIKNILNQAEAIWENWTPWRSISNYYNMVLFVFEIYSGLLIDCFRCTYPERFQLENIIDKYSNVKAKDN